MDGNINLASDMTLFRSNNPASDGFDVSQGAYSKNMTHTNPIVNSKKVVASHKNFMKSTVSKFINEH